MNCGTVEKHPADRYPVQIWIFITAGTRGGPEQAHFSPNRPEKGDTTGPLSQFWVLSTSEKNFAGTWEFCYEKNAFTGNSNWSIIYLCAFHQRVFWRGLEKLSNCPKTGTRLCHSPPLWAPLDQPQAFKEGNGKFGNWPVISAMEALAALSPSVDKSWFLNIQLYHQDTRECFQTQKQIAEHLKNRIWALH